MIDIVFPDPVLSLAIEPKSKEDQQKRVQLHLKKPINTKRIVPYWDTAQRIMISLDTWRSC